MLGLAILKGEHLLHKFVLSMDPSSIRAVLRQFSASDKIKSHNACVPFFYKILWKQTVAIFCLSEKIMRPSIN